MYKKLYVDDNIRGGEALRLIMFDDNIMIAPPISTNDIDKKLAQYGQQHMCVQYKTLKHIDCLETILPCTLLYHHHGGQFIGHFVAIFVNDEGLNYWDPLGMVPDALLQDNNFDAPEGRIQGGADFTYLRSLLYGYITTEGEAPRKPPRKPPHKPPHKATSLIWNDKKIQSSKSENCGRWTTLRHIFHEMTNDDFNNEFLKMPMVKREETIVKLFDGGRSPP